MKLKNNNTFLKEQSLDINNFIVNNIFTLKAH